MGFQDKLDINRAMRWFWISFVCKDYDFQRRGIIGKMEQFAHISQQNEDGYWMVPTQDYIDEHCRRYAERYGGRWVSFLEKDMPRLACEKVLEYKHSAGLCKGYCPFCQPEKAARADQAKTVQDVLKIFEPKIIESPAKQTKHEHLRQKSELKKVVFPELVPLGSAKLFDPDDPEFQDLPF
ncbi:MAG: hypothetical protein ABIG61_12075 [Planctomycetota bacterium]